jgi:hypothetical protein
VQTLTVSATSSDPTILPDPLVTYLSPSQTGSLALAPRANSNGTVTVTVTVNDHQARNNTASRQFTVTITPVNDGPVILPVADQVTSEDTAAVVSVTLLDPIRLPAADAAATLRLRRWLLLPASMSVTTAVRAPGVVPVKTGFGTAMIALVAGDGQFPPRTASVDGARSTRAALSHQRTNVNEDAQIAVAVIDPGRPRDIAVTADSSDLILLPPPGSPGGSAGNRTVTLAPATTRHCDRIPRSRCERRKHVGLIRATVNGE